MAYATRFFHQALQVGDDSKKGNMETDKTLKHSSYEL